MALFHGKKKAKLDPWDHVESAMALVVAGEIEAGKKAYRWMASSQEEVGGWCAEYRQGKPSNTRIETNFSSYLAVGLWHFYLVTQDKNFLEENYSVLDKAISFVCSMQTKHGDILWALNEEGLKLDDSSVSWMQCNL